MAKIQAKHALTALKISAAILLFTAKAFLYICLALYAVGELLFSEYQSAAIVEQTAIVEQPEPAAHVRSVAKSITPDPVLVVHLPIATLMDEEPSDAEKEGIAIDVDRDRYADLTAVQLRKECSTVGIKWRNAHGKSKHLSKAEMIAELSC